MNVKSCERKEKSTAELTVEISAEEFDIAVNEAYKKNKNRISVPGFRKGKAPRKIIENMYGANVFYEDAVDIILPSACSFGVSEEKLDAVGFPSVKDIDIGDDKTVTVVYVVGLYPEVELGKYKGVEAVKPKAVVEEKDIDREIEGVRLRNARIQTANRPAIGGDTAVIDFEGFVDGKPFEGGKGENYELVLGSHTFIPGFEEKVQGMVAGEQRDLDLVFPEQYKEDLAGKPVVFKVTLKEVKEKILPERDDEFAKDVSEFDTFEEYKNSIKESIQKDKETEAQKQFEDNVLDKIIEDMKCELPDAMIDEYVTNSMQNFSQSLASYGMDLGTYLSMTNMTLESMRESMRPSAEKQLRVSVAMEKIVELEKLEATEEEVEKAYADAADRYGMDIEDVKKNISKESIEEDVKLRAALKLVCDSAVAVDEPAEDEKPAEKAEEKAEEKTEEKPKKTTRKTTAKKSEEDGAEEKKPAAKKTTTRKTAAKKSEEDGAAEKKPAAKKTTTKKTAAKKDEAKDEPKDE